MTPRQEVLPAKISTVALDLEGTLIFHALDARPRTGLASFLEFCDRHFERVAVFTTVDESVAWEVVDDLADGGHVPSRLLARLEFVDWSGEYKDLRFIANVEPAQVLLVDDDAAWVHPDQRDQWIAVRAWNGEPDRELSRVRSEMERRLF